VMILNDKGDFFVSGGKIYFKMRYKVIRMGSERIDIVKKIGVIILYVNEK